MCGFLYFQICFIEEQKQLVHHSNKEQELSPPELMLEIDVADVKLQRSEMLVKQQKQEHYKSHLLALLKKLKEDERMLSKLLLHYQSYVSFCLIYCMLRVSYKFKTPLEIDSYMYIVDNLLSCLCSPLLSPHLLNNIPPGGGGLLISSDQEVENCGKYFFG